MTVKAEALHTGHTGKVEIHAFLEGHTITVKFATLEFLTDATTEELYLTTGIASKATMATSIS
jgi:hypothetical protein